MDILAEVLEILMLVCFGFSWPINVLNSLKSKTSKGKSPTFNILIIVGYIGGIASKFIKMNSFMADPNKDALTKGIFIFALVMYFVNMAMVTANLVLYFFYKAKDKKLDEIAAANAVVESTETAEVETEVVADEANN